jgi:hypothetical protein
MRTPRPRITLGWLMLAVAFIAVALAAFRAHFSLGSLVAGVLSVTWVEGRREIRRRPGGSSAREQALILRDSLLASLLVFFVSGYAFLITYAVSWCIDDGGWIQGPLERFSILGVVTGSVAAAITCWALRRELAPGSKLAAPDTRAPAPRVEDHPECPVPSAAP